MQEREDRGHKDESGDGGAKQAANHRAAKGCILLAAVSQSKRHRNHADDHRQRRHDYGAQARGPGLKRGRYSISMVVQPLLREGHDQNAVRCGDAHAHDGAHQRGNAERGAGDEQEQYDSSQSRRQRRDDDEWIKPRLEVHDDQQIDQDDGKRQSAEKA